MKTTKILTIMVMALGLVVCLPNVSKAMPMGTAWTYQGRLMDSNGPVDGIFEFQFELYDSPEDGNQVDGTFSLRAVDVIDGYFTVGLDFGGDVFDGDARWLEIGVRPGDTADPFTILTPRQEVTPTPYSFYADKAHNAFYAETAGTAEGGIEGNGTTGYVAKFTGPEAIGISSIYNNGSSVGIGTTNPNSRLHIWKPSSSSPVFQLDTQKIVGPLTVTEKLLFDGASIDSEGTMGAPPISLNPNSSGDVFLAGGGGQVGIRTTNPTALLDVKSKGTSEDVIAVHASDGSELFNVNEMGIGDGEVLIRDNAGDWKIRLSAWGFSLFNGGNVGIGDVGLPTRKLVVRGNILLQSLGTGANVLELGEGLDYAEGFDVTEDNEIDPGTVLVIDSDNPGKLTVCRSAYDSKVAGIVAGANGIGSGVRLGVDQFDHDVALAGRVYCKVDATEAAVQAGDLLTTSATAGYAMKATDYDRARGAILGKAMQTLQEGQKGQILVLVTLQ